MIWHMWAGNIKWCSFLCRAKWYALFTWSSAVLLSCRSKCIWCSFALPRLGASKALTSAHAALKHNSCAAIYSLSFSPTATNSMAMHLCGWERGLGSLIIEPRDLWSATLRGNFVALAIFASWWSCSNSAWLEIRIVWSFLHLCGAALTVHG